MDQTPIPPSYANNVERPAMLIALAFNVILAAALAITVVLKIYMLVLTDFTCTPDTTTLGNLIRCTATLDIVAGFLITSAAISFATTLLTPKGDIWSRALGLTAAAVFASLMNLIVSGDYNWRLSLAAGVVFAIIMTVNYSVRHLISHFIQR